MPGMVKPNKKLVRGCLGACAGLFFGSALSSALETMPLAAVIAQSLMTLSGIALGAGYPPMLSPLSDRVIAALGDWVRGPVGRRTVTVLLSGVTATIVLEWLKHHTGLDPFMAGSIPLLIFYTCLGVGLGWPDRVPKAIITLIVAGIPLAIFCGVMTYDNLCNFNHSAICAATPKFVWHLWSGLGFFAMFTGGLILIPIKFILPIAPAIAVMLALSPKKERQWLGMMGCAIVFLFSGQPALGYSFFMNFYQCAIPAALMGFVFGKTSSRSRTVESAA